MTPITTTTAKPEHQAAMTLDQASLPVIDLAPLMEDDASAHRAVAEALVEAAEIADQNAVIAERASQLLVQLGRYDEARAWQAEAQRRRGP